jgi:hypothetical protein
MAKVTIQSIMDAMAKPKQMENVKIILTSAWHRGVSPAVAISMVVNSDAESGINNDAFNPEAGLGYLKGWGSLGLFQTLKSAHSPPRGAAQYLELPPMVNGKPAANDPRRDPWINCKLILDEVERYYTTHKWGGASYAPSLRDAVEGGRVADVVSAFTRHIERPAERTIEGAKREQRAFAMFPSLAGLPAASLEWEQPYSAGADGIGLGSIAAPVFIFVVLLLLGGGIYAATYGGVPSFNFKQLG